MSNHYHVVLHVDIEGAEAEWIKSVNHYGSTLHEWVGHLDVLKDIAQKIKRKWLKGYSKAMSLFKPAF